MKEVFFLEPLNRKRERQRISVMCLGLSSCVIFSLVGLMIFSYLVAFVNPTLARDSAYMNWIQAAAQYLLGFPICILIMTRIPADPIEKYHMSGTLFLRFLCMSIGLLVLGEYLGLGVNAILALLMGHDPRDILNESMNNASMAYNIITTVIAAPILEELVFRKCLLDRVNRLGDVPSILLSGLIFGLFHGNFYQCFYAMLVGCLFAYVYLRTGQVLYTIGLHMLINLLFGVNTLLLSRLAETSFLMTLVLDFYTICMLLAAAAGLILLVLDRKKLWTLKGFVELPGGRWKGIAFVNVGMIFLIMICAAVFVLNTVML